MSLGGLMSPGGPGIFGSVSTYWPSSTANRFDIADFMSRSSEESSSTVDMTREFTPSCGTQLPLCGEVRYNRPISSSPNAYIIDRHERV